MTTHPLPAMASPEAESRGFIRLQWRIVRTQLAQGFAASRLRYGLVIVLSALLWFGLFYLVRQGFDFMRQMLPGLFASLAQEIFNTFFLALFLMLIFSSAVILYGSLFHNGEVAYLLTVPIRDERIFHHKFQHAVVLSSWGFLLLGSPMMVAYGLAANAPWYYYAMMPAMLVAFVFIPAGIGAILLLLIMQFFPRGRLQLLAIFVGLLAALAVWLVWSLIARPEGDVWFQEMRNRLQLTQKKPLPNWWLSTGLLESAGGAWPEGMMYLGLLIANALFFREIAGIFAARSYRRAYWEAAGLGSRPPRVERGSSGRAINGFLASLQGVGLSPGVRLILIKDLRLFCRDPLQWSQSLIYIGLLLMYFLNVHPVSYALRFSQWVNVVSFMNFSVVGLLMSTFTTRFVFPLVSLEGRRFWLLGLLPLKRDSILWAKFIFSVGSLLIPCGLLILLSDWRLGVPALLLAQHQLASVLLCLGLSGIGVGLGARLPVITEPSPSRIAAGFGGTLSLVISTLFILLILTLATLPCHVYLARQVDPSFSFGGELAPLQPAVRTWLIAGSLTGLAISALAMILPMWIGIRTFRRQEFH
jgi:ABC-2 type transport system permease protein